MDAKDAEIGQWYKVELPVQEVKVLQGKLVRIIRSEEGNVLMFKGRFNFSAVTDELVSIEETEPPKTGVTR